MRLAVVFGTRPEIIKLSMLLKLASGRGDIELFIIHTGQHYSYNLSKRFLEDLELPGISEDIAVGSLERLDQIRKILWRLEPLLIELRPDMVLVQGDTNSTLAGAIAAWDSGVPVAHVEAGLRCFDDSMVEEMNRRETDRLSDICFAPTEVSVANLEREGIPRERISMVGNTIIEVVSMNLEIARERSNILERLNLDPDTYILVTAHRQENVEDMKRLNQLVSALERIQLPMVYPVHPRTMERFVEQELFHRLESVANLEMTEPLPYWDFLELSRNSRMIITDSGGIQEECTVYGKPVIVIRDSTERPEILGTFGVLTGSDPDLILHEVKRLDGSFPDVAQRLSRTPSPFGDGRASERILDEIVSRL